jgi:hypothetical protein
MGMKLRPWRLAVFATAAIALSSACASTARVAAPPLTSSSPTSVSAGNRCRNFTLSLAINHGGQPSALLAARWFAHGHNGLAGWSIPTSGWTPSETADGQANVTSGSTTLEVVQLSDGTWAVESGQQCPSNSTSGRSGTIIGVLEAIGGAAPGTPRPLPGTITIHARDGSTFTASAGSGGTFMVQIPIGSYTVTGRSPLYQNGTSDCGLTPPATVAITADGTTRVTIDCQEK